MRSVHPFVLAPVLLLAVITVAPSTSARAIPDCYDCPQPIVRVTPTAGEDGASVAYTVGLGLGLGGAVAVYGDAGADTSGGVDCGGGFVLGRQRYDVYTCG